jgi:hypothetical protein
MPFAWASMPSGYALEWGLQSGVLTGKMGAVLAEYQG